MSNDRVFLVRHLQDGLLIGADAGWAWFSLRTHPYDLLSNGKRLEYHGRNAALLEELVGRECHMIVAHRSYPVAERLEALATRTERPTEAWADQLEVMRQRLENQELHRREVFLGVRLGDVGRTGWAKRLLDDIPGLVGLDDPRPERSDVAMFAREVELLQARLAAPAAGIRPATASELRWLLARTMFRGRLESVDIPAPPNRPAMGGELEALVDGELTKYSRFVRVGDELSGYGYAAFLSFGFMPSTLYLPGTADWLHMIDLLDYPIEVSLRFRVLSPQDAAQDARRSKRAALDMLDHHAELGIETTIEAEETFEAARELEHSTVRGRQSSVHVWPRVVVTAPDMETLAERVAEVVALFRSRGGHELTRSAGDQGDLFLEAMPTGQLYERYVQKMPPRTLGAAMWGACGDLGDDRGPYIGWTTGPSRSPVMFDPLAAAAEDNVPTGVAFTGQPGGGKSMAALLMVALARMRGATCVVIDPYFGAQKLMNVPGLGRTQIVRLDESLPGILDPWRIEANAKDGALLAAEMVRAFLPTGLARQVYGNLLAAVGEESHAARPCLRGLVRRLAGSPDPQVQAAAGVLTAMEEWPLSRLCLGEPTGEESLSVDNALTIIQLSNLQLPSAGTPADEYEVPEMLSVGVMLGVTALAQKLLRSGGPSQPKVLAIDEAWFLTAAARGLRMIQEIARNGRKYNTALFLISQVVADFKDERVRNCFSAIFAFRSRDLHEIQAICELMGLEATADVIELMRVYFESGDCFFKDPHERLGQMHIDPGAELLRTLGTTPGQQREEAIPAA